MRADLAVLNNCAVPFLSRAAVNICWYYILMKQKSLLFVVTKIHPGITQIPNMFKKNARLISFK